MIELIRRVHDELGVTFFDTAECYGPYTNEELVGEALEPIRNEVKIATKFGIALRDFKQALDSRPETIRQSVEGSLKRLRTDHIDLYYQHRVDKQTAPEEVAETIAQLMKEGKVLHWGMSEAGAETIRRAHKVCPVTAIENRYSTMARRHESLFPMLEELNIGYVAFSPLANGLLTNSYKADSQFDGKTDYRAAMPQFQKESFEKNQQLFDLINKLAEEKSATPSQISLAWMLCKKPWIVPIPGTRKESRLRENAGAADIVLTSEEVNNIDIALDNMDMSAVFGGSRITK